MAKKYSDYGAMDRAEMLDEMISRWHEHLNEITRNGRAAYPFHGDDLSILTTLICDQQVLDQSGYDTEALELAKWMRSEGYPEAYDLFNDNGAYE